jgi:hypothetical protein
VFHTKDIDLAIEKGKLYDPANPVAMSPKSMGIDPAYLTMSLYAGNEGSKVHE